MIETIQIPLEFVRNIAEMRRAQKQGDPFRSKELEKIVDLELATITNTLEQLKQGRFYDDDRTEVESRL
jgi:MinD-like ATPase involved in chromosome partitioning or flagellar assembly